MLNDHLPLRVHARTGLRFTELSLGCAQIGNLFRAISDDDAQATIDVAWDAGVRYFDTAPHYGLGLSEQRVGAALRERPRDEYVLSTKVGRLLVPVDGPVVGRDDDGFEVPAAYRRVWDFSRDGILRSLESSLERLGLDRIDVVYLHDPDDFVDDVIEHAYPALAELREQGVVRAIGAGMNTVAPLVRFARETEMDIFMVAGRYTLLEQPALEELMPLCEERGIGVVAAGVFNSGLLARALPAAGARYDYAAAPEEVLQRARSLGAVCEQHGASLPGAAIAFPLGHPAVLTVCVGARSPEQMERNLALYRAGVSSSLWPELVQAALISPDAPTPAAS